MSATGPPTWDECRSKGLEEIAAHIRPEASYILVDQDEWGIDELPLRRRRVPFVEHNGTYWGTPADDETAIGEFERLRQEGASFLVVARPAYWWLDYYHEWCHHLVSRFRCVLANDRVCIFDLQQSSDTDSAFAGLSDLIKNEGHGRRQQQRLIYPPGDLRNHERAVFSENGEDGILQEIFKRIGTDTKFFVEFGVGSGRYCNCARLVLEENWNGLFMECDSNSFRRLQRRFRGHQKVSCIQAMVTPQNFEALLATHHVPPDFDVLSIDIDGNDYWVWAALKHWHPRVVVIEYRAALAPPEMWVMEEDANRHGDGSGPVGASLASLASLGKRMGYVLVATSSGGVNAFFVRSDLVVDDKFLDPAVFYYYSPPRQHQ